MSLVQALSFCNQALNIAHIKIKSVVTSIYSDEYIQLGLNTARNEISLVKFQFG
jgi:hypothetical protein